MIYFENDEYSSSLYKVEGIGGRFYGWNVDSRDGWEGSDYTIYPNEGGYTQTFLAPSILDRWSS